MFRTLLIGLSLLSASPLLAQDGKKPRATERDNRRADALVLRSAAIKAAFKEVVADVNQSVVKILCDGKDAAIGAIVTKEGHIITKASELRGKILCRFLDGRELEAKIVGVEDAHDLAMIKVEPGSSLTPVQWRDSKNAEVGNWVVTVGIDEEPVSIGVVSVATRKMHPRFDYPPSKVNPNNGYLGVSLGNAKEGAAITMVAKDSAAEKSGLKVDDVILTVAGKKISDIESLQMIISNYRVGDTVAIKIKRDDEDSVVKVTLGKKPNSFLDFDRAAFQNGMGREISIRNTGFPVALQHDTVLRARDCGGPLVDLDGKVLAINIASSGRVESYAIPAETVQGLLPGFLSGKFKPSGDE